MFLGSMLIWRRLRENRQKRRRECDQETELGMWAHKPRNVNSYQKLPEKARNESSP